MLNQLWIEFTDLPFPDHVPREVRASIDLELLDAEAAACVEAFLMTGVLNDPELGILRASQAELRDLLPQLRGEAAEYFRRLAQLCALVLNRVDTPATFM